MLAYVSASRLSGGIYTLAIAETELTRGGSGDLVNSDAQDRATRRDYLLPSVGFGVFESLLLEALKELDQPFRVYRIYGLA